MCHSAHAANLLSLEEQACSAAPAFLCVGNENGFCIV